MKQVTITELKKMSVAQLKEAMPIEVMADGTVIGVVNSPGAPAVSGKVTCPNCKFVIEVQPKDTAPSFFSVQHP